MSHHPFIPGSTGRDRRLDVFRGLAVLTIFINHVPGNVFEDFTSRNWGFSDAAEAFVLMSGIAVGLAYTRTLEKGDFSGAFKKMWLRAFKLYWVHLVVISACFIILAVTVRFFGADQMINKVGLRPLIDHPDTSPFAVPLLTYQIGYVNILPLYMVLLLMSPGLMWLAMGGRWMLLWLSIGVWFTIHMCMYAGHWLNLPNWPHSGRWFLNPFGWQLLFVIGLLGGVSVKQGRKFAPYNPILYMLALAYALFSFYWIQNRLGALPFNEYLPRIATDFNKSYLALPRLLHTLSLTYLVINTRWPKWFATTKLWNPIEKMGQNGLPVFAVGTVLSIFLQCIREVMKNNFGWGNVPFVVDAPLFAAGIYIHYLVAIYASRGKAAPSPKSAQPTANAALANA